MYRVVPTALKVYVHNQPLLLTWSLLLSFWFLTSSNVHCSRASDTSLLPLSMAMLRGRSPLESAMNSTSGQRSFNVLATLRKSNIQVYIHKDVSRQAAKLPCKDDACMPTLHVHTYVHKKTSCYKLFCVTSPTLSLLNTKIPPKKLKCKPRSTESLQLCPQSSGGSRITCMWGVTWIRDETVAR